MEQVILVNEHDEETGTMEKMEAHEKALLHRAISVFIFNSNGTVAATNGSINANGTWSQASSKFNIDFGVTPVFSDLNDDWLIVEKTATSIKLKDDNPARNEKLEFVKL